MLGMGTTIRSTEDFNQRALSALLGLSRRTPFVDQMVRLLSDGKAPSRDQQQCLFNVIHENRRQITDQMLLTYAVLQANGAN